MHLPYFVIFNQDEAENSQEARGRACNYLLDEGFCNRGYFSREKADWFVIGGAFSGVLSETKPRYEESNESNENVQKCWKKILSKYIDPNRRDVYRERGYKDDAMIIDEDLFNRLQKNWGDVEIYDANDCYEITLEKLQIEDVIGKWIVVIDYHS